MIHQSSAVIVDHEGVFRLAREPVPRHTWAAVIGTSPTATLTVVYTFLRKRNRREIRWSIDGGAGG